MMKARLRMFYFGLAHAPDGPWQAHCRILNQDRTGTCPRTAVAAPQSFPASANPTVHAYYIAIHSHTSFFYNQVQEKYVFFIIRYRKNMSISS